MNGRTPPEYEHIIGSNGWDDTLRQFAKLKAIGVYVHELIGGQQIVTVVATPELAPVAHIRMSLYEWKWRQEDYANELQRAHAEMEDASYA